MKQVTYNVRLNMESTQDFVRQYTHDVECNTIAEAREIIRDLTNNYKNAFKHHYLNCSEYDFVSVQNVIFKQTREEKQINGI